MLTLDQALAIAAEQNLDIQKAREYENWVMGKYVEERAAALPQVAFSANALRQFDDSQSKLFANIPGLGGGDPGTGEVNMREIFGGRQDVRYTQINVNQAVYTWGQVGAAIQAARLGTSVADDQLRQFRQAVAKDVSTAFYDTLAAKELANLTSENLAQKQRHLDETRRKREAGTATDDDVLAADVAVRNARPATIRAANQVRVNRDQLRFLLAVTDDIDVVGTLETELQAPPQFDTVLISRAPSVTTGSHGLRWPGCPARSIRGQQRRDREGPLRSDKRG
jgi:outer membrane protein TolC